MTNWVTDGSVPEFDEFKWVLVAIGDEVWPATWNGEEQQWEFNDGPPAHTVDAWMEMPAPPSEDEFEPVELVDEWRLVILVEHWQYDPDMEDHTMLDEVENWLVEKCSTEEYAITRANEIALHLNALEFYLPPGEGEEDDE